MSWWDRSTGCCATTQDRPLLGQPWPRSPADEGFPVLLRQLLLTGRPQGPPQPRAIGGSGTHRRLEHSRRHALHETLSKSSPAARLTVPTPQPLSEGWAWELGVTETWPPCSLASPGRSLGNQRMPLYPSPHRPQQLPRGAQISGTEPCPKQDSPPLHLLWKEARPPSESKTWRTFDIRSPGRRQQTNMVSLKVVFSFFLSKLLQFFDSIKC